LKGRIEKGKLLTAQQFGTREVGVQLVFLEDVVNFCFWAPKGQEGWSVEHPQGRRSDGWAGLVACFDRARDEGIPILDASFLQDISEDAVRRIFRGVDDVVIPLLNERIGFLREAGRVLKEKFGGAFDNVLAKASFDADKLTRLIISSFPSFADRNVIDGRSISFYKRAQICTYDLSLLPDISIANIDHLTVCADYKLPQVFRALEILTYSPELAQKVDAMTLLPPGGREETEIRAATIWVGELLAGHLNMAPALIDNAVWFMRNDIPTPYPYHRTLTTCY
ncbi:MAG: queuosine salvage family protein, partial [bacterium]|nr:queuosine salvage family protein [bacterium]